MTEESSPAPAEGAKPAETGQPVLPPAGAPEAIGTPIPKDPAFVLLALASAEPASGEHASGNEPADVPDASGAMRDRLELGLLALVLLFAAGWLAFLQFGTHELVDHDSLYHVRAANVLASKGPLRGCPWMQATFLHDHFADKEFLFHAILAPFCGDEDTMDRNAKIATVLLGTLVVAAFAFTLRGLRVRHAWLWVLVLLGSSSDFLVRLCMTRPHLLAIAFLLLGIRFVLEQRWLAVYFVAFFYTWSYSAPELLPAIALVAAIARYGREQAIQPRSFAPAAAGAVGVLSGLTLNPFAPSSFYVFWVQNVLVVERAWGFRPGVARLGSELGPMATRSLLESSPGLCLAFAVGLGACLLARRRPSLRTVQLAAIALAGIALLFLSEKFMDYAAPLTVLFAASAVDDQWRGEGSLAKSAWAGIYALVLLGLLAFAGARAYERVSKIPPPPLKGAARWLREHAQAGDVVAHFSWDDFSTLFHEDTAHFYLFGLDPTFMEVWYPDDLAYMEDIRNGKRELDPRWFAERFRARWLVVPKFRRTEITACDVAGLEPKYGLTDDETAVVYALPDK